MDEYKNSKLPDIDINSSDFFDKLQDEIESDVARLKKTVEVLKQLRLTAAEDEVDTAALYHDELFKCIEELKYATDKFNDLQVSMEEETKEKRDLEIHIRD